MLRILSTDKFSWTKIPSVHTSFNAFIFYLILLFYIYINNIKGNNKKIQGFV